MHILHLDPSVMVLTFVILTAAELLTITDI